MFVVRNDLLLFGMIGFFWNELDFWNDLDFFGISCNDSVLLG